MHDPFDDASGPPVLGGRDLLTEDEKVLGAAYLRLVPLLERLGEHPFDRHLYAELRDYLDGQAWLAADAFERLCDRGARYLSARLRVVETGLGEGEAR